jgi:transposase
VGSGELLIPRAKRGGRKREVVARVVLNGILYVLRTACQRKRRDTPTWHLSRGYDPIPS